MQRATADNLFRLQNMKIHVKDELIYRPLEDGTCTGAILHVVVRGVVGFSRGNFAVPQVIFRQLL
jgi:hypothetical protein